MRHLRICLPLVLCALWIAACAPRIIYPPITMEVYYYADGNNNSYTLRPDSLIYDPMTPERSSSGSYSGGAPARKAISAETYSALSDLFEDAILDTQNQIRNREMGSGRIAVEGKPEPVYLKPTAVSKQLLETGLKNALR